MRKKGKKKKSTEKIRFRRREINNGLRALNTEEEITFLDSLNQGAVIEEMFPKMFQNVIERQRKLANGKWVAELINRNFYCVF